MPKRNKPAFPLEALIEESVRLPVGRQENQLVVDDFVHGQALIGDELSSVARQYEGVFGPILDAELDLSGVSERFVPTYRLACAATMHSILKQTTIAEATTASTNLQTVTTQKLFVCTRIFSSLRALQLFNTFAMSGPTARVDFLRFFYATAGPNGSNIEVGDSIDDPLKQSTAYANHSEGTAARAVSFEYFDMLLSCVDRRVAYAYSDRFDDELQSVFGEAADPAHLDIAARVVAQTIDQELMEAAELHVPAANTYEWDARPLGYNSLTPGQQAVADGELLRIAFNEIINRIGKTTRLQQSPNWCVTGAKGWDLLRKLQVFSTGGGDGEGDFKVMVGTLPGFKAGAFGGLRVYCDDKFDADPADTATAKFLFGHRSSDRNEAALALGLWIPAKPTERSYNPGTGMWERAIRSSFCVVQPDASVPESRELARCLGLLTVNL